MAFGHLLGDGLHPFGLVLAAELLRHAPGVQGHHLEGDAVVRCTSGTVFTMLYLLPYLKMGPISSSVTLQ